jgi:hypothetical protein
VVIIETPTFTRRLASLLSDDEYLEVQVELIQNPEAGKLIPGGEGLRKLRWTREGKGKRGGVRIIYYWVMSEDQIGMLLIYSKNEQDNFTPEQLKALRRVIREQFS